MLTRKLTSGHTFAFQFRDGAWGHGRVLLNIQEQCVRPKRLAGGSPLAFFAKGLVVEIMREVTEVADAPAPTPLITGIYVDDSAFRADRFPLTGMHAVAAADLDFPQSLGRAPDPVFFRGEVWVPIGLDDDEIDAIDLNPTLHPSGALPGIAAHHLGRPPEDDAIAPEWRGLERADIRFSPHRAKILGAVDDPSALTTSYLELARAHGVDPSRFLV
jgi:hypothetical protein